MKNNGILIVGIIALVAIAYFFLTKKKSGSSNVSTTMSNESTTGVTALFNTGAMSSLFGTFGKVGDAAGTIATATKAA